jgi:SAM-dependent methyltransferase
MDRAEYQKMHEVEGRMWWYHGLHANLLTALGQPRAGSRVLDAGCGTGGFLRNLRHRLPECGLVGMDFAEIAAGLAREKSAAAVCVGSINELPFATGSLGAIISADVLCHRSVDERRALGDLFRCLEPGGILVLNLPAYNWMMSAHDRAVHTARRYTGRRLRQLLAEVGFAEVRIRYWNSLLFPLMVIRRKLPAATGASSDVMPFPAPVEFGFRMVMRLENFLLRHGLSSPFGGSVLAIAVKHG